jgi:DNA-binding GntR family transcriptional regulator
MVRFFEFNPDTKIHLFLHAKMDKPVNLLTLANPMNTAERVYCQIKEMLFNYQIVPGQKLQCQDLAEKFRVSRTPVKDALNMLQREGYVELKHNRGYFVSELGIREAEGLYDLRETLEALVVKKAVAHFSREPLKELREAMRAFSADLKRSPSRKRLILDANFHLRIAEMTGNRTLVEMMRLIFSRIYLKHKAEHLSPRRGKIADSDHREIYRAISRKDAAAAAEKMKKHTNLSRRSVLEILSAEEE